MSFIFMQFKGKFGQIIDWHPPLWGWRPPSGKSWIRHCIEINAWTLHNSSGLHGTRKWKLCNYHCQQAGSLLKSTVFSSSIVDIFQSGCTSSKSCLLGRFWSQHGPWDMKYCYRLSCPVLCMSCTLIWFFSKVECCYCLWTVITGVRNVWGRGFGICRYERLHELHWNTVNSYLFRDSTMPNLAI